MIRVNLLQLKRKKKPKPLPSFVIIGVLVMVLAIIAVGFIYFNRVNKINSLKALQAANQKRIEELKKKVKEVEHFEASIRKFESRKKVIEDLRRNQSVPVQILNEISFLLADGVWLEDMEIKGKVIKIKGNAFTNSNIVEFVNNLKKSPLFVNVFLSESKEKTVEKLKIFEFKMEFNVKA